MGLFRTATPVPFWLKVVSNNLKHFPRCLIISMRTGFVEKHVLIMKSLIIKNFYYVINCMVLGVN